MFEDKISKVSKRIVFMFPGQGSQYRNMGIGFLEANSDYRRYFEIASKITDKDLLEIIGGNSKKNLLDETRFSQISIYTLSCALNDYLFNVLSINKNCIGTVTGHSLGEYSALYSAGAYDFKKGAELVKYRSLIMDDENRSQNGMMAAVLGMNERGVEDVVKSSRDRVFIANYNDYTQIVVSGYEDAVKDAIERLKEKGAKRIIPLKVGIASHCPLMEKVSDKLGKFINGNVKFKKMGLPFFSTTEAAYRNSNDIAGTLTGQLVNPIRWVDSIGYLLEEGAGIFIEVGPGKVLSGLVNRIARENKREVVLLNTDKIENIEELGEKLKKEGMINEA